MSTAVGVPVLAVQHLEVEFVLADSTVSAVSDVSLSVGSHEILGIVGESGCGKSTLAMAIMGLLGSRARVRGAIEFEGRDLVGLAEKDRHALRGDRMSMVFQDPMTSLDPLYGIGSQIMETIQAHHEISDAEARAKTLALLVEVGLPAAAQRFDEPPHRLSGGMRQRVVVATALANDPALLIADEPTTALDVTIQAQILDLLRALRDRHGTAILLITHDLGVVAQICDRVAVMYAGQLVELAPVGELFRAPRHPYTRALLAAQPTSDQERGRLRVIPGEVADLADPPPGCRFTPRCPLAFEACVAVPALETAGPGHTVACWAVSAGAAGAAGSTAPSREAAGSTAGAAA